MLQQIIQEAVQHLPIKRSPSNELASLYFYSTNVVTVLPHHSATTHSNIDSEFQVCHGDIYVFTGVSSDPYCGFMSVFRKKK